ncbi:discoidin domain-containing protein [Micromonospora sp. DR5-3]|uniref:discoidin domain-containing protein n=1 Tax=unclassified Micromonospora TaxID=2617518 RepID=UPI001652097E|nr:MULTISPECIES: discoidin domain-containing protein [unclassified Micromonospora]MCW3815443.1 discoidin domain-containing protein [Micromonospora sp. DR5-3]
MRASRPTRLRRRVVAPLALVALLVAGCTASKVPDDAEVTVSGRLTRADGAPAAGVSVVLYKEPDAAEVVGGVLATVTSLGLLCLARAVEVCKGARKAKTDSTGTYMFRLTGRDTQGTFGTASTMALSAQLPGETAGRPAVHARFKIQRTELAVPTLAFWEPADLAVRPDPSKVSVRWADRPTQQGRKSPQYTATAITDDEAGDVVWVAEGVRPGQALDARAIGDLRGYLYVTATAEIEDNGTKYTTRQDSQRVRLVGALGPPRSRDEECAVADQRGRATPLVPCSLTDGAYGQSYRHQGCQETGPSGAPPTPPATRSARACRSNTFLQVDLGARRPVAAVFAHGLSVSSPVVIETSDDGTTWSPRAEARRVRFLKVTLPTGTSARYVRLSQQSGQEITELNELAVWS